MIVMPPSYLYELRFQEAEGAGRGFGRGVENLGGRARADMVNTEPTIPFEQSVLEDF